MPASNPASEPASRLPLDRPWRTYGASHAFLDPELEAVWFRARRGAPPRMTPQLLEDVGRFARDLEELMGTQRQAVRFVVTASDVPGIYSLGGDLALFVELIRARDRDGLARYAARCVEAVHGLATGFGLGVTTVALVQGAALGGGFEAALACRLIVAERQSSFGFPEPLFGLFPGMGAYTFLGPRVGPAMARRMMLDGVQRDAERLHRMGIVDLVAAEGEGEAVLARHLKERLRRPGPFEALERIAARHEPVDLAQLREIAALWVETALRLGEREVRTMERLLRAQARREGGGAAGAPSGVSHAA